ncbi:xylulokinase [Sphingomonas sp. SUN039]|uniref:xylulokinase n=1 Tax=Sphingomonas sp. SUN039 TaxID=2937787 RepID=UPI002164399C|nr:xylulokinase [Sphingomonas sp. SUN039]UVO53086.1 xylulokinase [Sphingomonas sp. SUN039]
MYLGIDVGTSGVKVVAVAPDGSLRAQATSPLSVARPHPLWSEQDADDWVAATEAAVLELPSAIRAKVQAIGLAGQMHGATLLGADDRPLRPAILWNDGRSFGECGELEATVPESRAITGNIAMPGFTAPKLLWVRKHEPRVFDAVRTVLLPKDYVRLALTGDKASDLADSAGTLWLDTGKRSWSDAMLAACHLDEGQMPSLHEGSAVTGHLRPAVAERWGMARVPVVAGGGDNAAAAAGVGVVDDGDALLSLGTSGVIFVATRAFRPNPARAVHAFCHCLPDMWHQMSVHLSAASCVDWAARLCGVDVARMFALAEQVGTGTGDELFLPYLSGERTPHNDPHVRGMLLGLDNDSDAGRIAAAVLEGVAFAHADGLAALREAGTMVETLAVVGGGARSQHWGRVIAAALDARLTYLDGGEVGPALGAARLAQIGATGATIADVCTRPPVRAVIEPEAELADRLAPRLERFRAAYPALKSI